MYKRVHICSFKNCRPLCCRRLLWPMKEKTSTSSPARCVSGSSGCAAVSVRNHLSIHSCVRNAQSFSQPTNQGKQKEKDRVHTPPASHKPLNHRQKEGQTVFFDGARRKGPSPFHRVSTQRYVAICEITPRKKLEAAEFYPSCSAESFLSPPRPQNTDTSVYVVDGQVP